MMDVHGGEIYKLARELNCSSKDILDFSANINPFGFPDWTRIHINRFISELVHYPERDYFELKNKIAKCYFSHQSNIVVANGLSEIFAFLPYIFSERTPIVPVPSFSEYVRPWFSTKTKVITVPLREEDDFEVTSMIWSQLENHIVNVGEKNSIVYLGHPNNPTGKCLHVDQLRAFILKHPQAIFVIDEAFIDFVEKKKNLDFLENVIILRSLTKILAIPGLRLAFAICNSSLAKKIQDVLPSWNVNTLAAMLGCEYFDNELRNDFSFSKEVSEQVSILRDDLLANLNNILPPQQLRVFASEANFILLKFLNRSSKEVVSKLIKEHKIAVRDASTFPALSDGFIRVAVRGAKENSQLLKGLGAYASANSRVNVRVNARANSLMLVGTGSSVGKSILTAGLLRIFYQDGLSVAPFKAQNMSLNSYVTIRGEEIGRAQGLQAQAAGVVADSRMNPILLKPNSDSGSQVILNGKPIANMHYTRYAQFKSNGAFDEVKKAYDSLREEYQLVVMEGAGSISEVNLKQNDLVNLNMAKYANATCYLVGDIDRGGVFGQFVGSIATLAEWEKKLIKGLIINRFRGIESLLKDGIDYLEDNLGVPVLGVVPYLKDIKLPDEDSMEFQGEKFHDDSLLGDRIDIAVIDLPKISNFTDLDPFIYEKDVRLRIVKNVMELGEPDLIIIPGSKNVISDYLNLCERGLDSAICRLVRSKRSMVFGICGGFQMLGLKITDPYKIESMESADTLGLGLGLGLLPIETVLEKNKTLLQTKGIHQESKLSVSGYEIHHGVSRVVGECVVTIDNMDATPLAFASIDGQIHGSYLHGIFDEDQFRRYFLDQIHIRKGQVPIEKVTYAYSVEKNLDALALALRKSLDIKKIYEHIYGDQS
ncbi:MAG: cobyric acid synthase [Oligoflexia bacterium]|nr:cobyric acid synthase [Oligoflexia bacterium]